MNAYDQALSIAMLMLRGEQSPSPVQIREKVKLVMAMLAGNPDVGGPGFTEDDLVHDLESRLNISMGVGTALSDDKDHIPWLSNKRAEVNWRFWRRYERYLLEDRSWPPNVVRVLAELTDNVLEKLEDPSRPGKWDRRGMVVGNVQSGKTANYTGLVCKAADAGYRVIIILAGLHNSLRSQTQLRLDEGFLGFNTERATAYSRDNRLIGVGNVQVDDLPIAHALTGSAETGDFRRTAAEQINVVPGGNDPVILVVKKNGRILENLKTWLSIRAQVDPADNHRRIRNVPLLLLDDEADNASVNTKPIPLDPDTGQPLPEYNVTAINRLIRELLDMFEKSAYVGYTATPFANIYIDPSDQTGAAGEGLFPRSFIVNLPAPSNYIGPSRVFGLDVDPEAGILDENPGLPITRTVNDSEDWLKTGHKSYDDPSPFLPASLKEALHSFVLTCAARAARGQQHEHNSMLIHVTRFVAVQRKVTEQVKEELQTIQHRLQYGDGSSASQIVSELEELWNCDFVETSAKVSEVIEDRKMRPVTWSDVAEHLKAAALRINVKTINGSAADILDYHTQKEGVSVIAIGGDKLSRGLTLEGLSVSYFLRASKMYDTLMQMGRWFGYRPGYADLCRLYTTDELIEWYKHVALASEELRKDFDYMASIGGTPKDYGLRVRTHPSGLVITSASKLRTGTIMRVSYAGTISETVVFEKNPERVKANFATVKNFVSRLPKLTGEDFRWERNIDAREVLTFLDGFTTHRDAPKVDSRLLASYIRKKISEGELIRWSVALISVKEGKRYDIAGYAGGLVTRAPHPPLGEQRSDKITIRRLVNPTDEEIGLAKDQRDAALAWTREKWAKDGGDKRGAEPGRPSGTAIRYIRPKEEGLLLIYPLSPEEYKTDSEIPVMGIALSFPGTDNPDGVEYRVNNKYWEQEFELI